MSKPPPPPPRKDRPTQSGADVKPLTVPTPVSVGKRTAEEAFEPESTAPDPYSAQYAQQQQQYTPEQYAEYAAAWASYYQNYQADPSQQQQQYYDPNDPATYAASAGYDYAGYGAYPSMGWSGTSDMAEMYPEMDAATLKKLTRAGKQKKTEQKVDFRNLPKDAVIRSAGGEVWQDNSLADWGTNDFRLFVGNLGPEVHDAMLREAFQKYPSFNRSRVVRDPVTSASKGYGFVSFQEAEGYAKAFREINGSYIGNRPVKLSKSNWKDRNVSVKEAKKISREGLMKLITKGDM